MARIGPWSAVLGVVLASLTPERAAAVACSGWELRQNGTSLFTDVNDACTGDATPRCSPPVPALPQRDQPLRCPSARRQPRPPPLSPSAPFATLRAISLVLRCHFRFGGGFWIGAEVGPRAVDSLTDPRGCAVARLRAAPRWKQTVAVSACDFIVHSSAVDRVLLRGASADRVGWAVAGRRRWHVAV